jgi:hypothetical protein
MIDLLVLTSIDQLFLVLKIYFYFFTKPSVLMRRPNVLSFSLRLGFHSYTFGQAKVYKRRWKEYGVTVLK